MTLVDKADRLLALANIMEKNAKEYADIISSEVGKPIVQARG
jgi:acyl-CoA reductase-like NAD-dependent aldehyde dehydrogenase